MARDLNVNRKTVDSDQYVYREERDLSKTRVDWGAISKDLTKTITDIRDDRQSRKDELDKAQTESMNQLAEFDQYNNKSLNESVLEGSEWSKNALSEQYDLMRRGLITPSEYKRYEQRTKDSFGALKGNLDNFAKHYEEAALRVQNGESNIGEAAVNNSLSGLANLGQYELSGNPATGELCYIKTGNDPATGKPYDSKNPSNQISLGVINARINQKMNYVATSEAALGEVDKLGEVVDAKVLKQQGVKTMEDWRLLENSEEMMDRMVGVITNSDAQKLNILQEAGYTSDDFTQNPDVAADDPSKILMTPNPDKSGGFIFEFNDEQTALIETDARLAIEAQISQKAGFTKGFDPDSPSKAGARKEQSSSFGYIDQTMEVITGDNTEFNSAASSLKTAWDKANPDNPMDEDKPIDRSTDPNYILVNYANGEVEKIAKFELDAKGNQILNEDGQPIPVADELLVQNLLTKVAPVTGSTQGLMDEYIQENPDGLVDRGGREETTSYQGTGDKTIEDTSLGNKMILVEGSPMNVGDRLLAISQQEGSDEEQLAEYTTVINSILSSELKDITANFEVSSEDITTGVGNRNFITVTIDGVPTEIEFDTVDDSAKLQSEVQKAINAAKKKIRDKRSKSSTSNNSGGKVRT